MLMSSNVSVALDTVADSNLTAQLSDWLSIILLFETHAAGNETYLSSKCKLQWKYCVAYCILTDLCHSSWKMTIQIMKLAIEEEAFSSYICVAVCWAWWLFSGSLEISLDIHLFYFSNPLVKEVLFYYLLMKWSSDSESSVAGQSLISLMTWNKLCLSEKLAILSTMVRILWSNQSIQCSISNGNGEKMALKICENVFSEAGYQ